MILKQEIKQTGGDGLFWENPEEEKVEDNTTLRTYGY